jgi:hypothetical protein
MMPAYYLCSNLGIFDEIASIGEAQLIYTMEEEIADEILHAVPKSTG